jgi:two-component system chemotaxis sensor kinase CheA
VDEVIGQQQIVIKKLGDEIMGIPGVLGGAVLSNGEPALILDLTALKPGIESGGALNAA